jgi:hypothetical protein
MQKFTPRSRATTLSKARGRLRHQSYKTAENTTAAFVYLAPGGQKAVNRGE